MMPPVMRTPFSFCQNMSKIEVVDTILLFQVVVAMILLFLFLLIREILFCFSMQFFVESLCKSLLDDSVFLCIEKQLFISFSVLHIGLLSSRIKNARENASLINLTIIALGSFFDLSVLAHLRVKGIEIKEMRGDGND